MAVVSFISAESISVNDAVVLVTGGKLRKAIATDINQSNVVGVALDTVTSGELVRVNPDYVRTGYSGLIAGEFQYLSPTVSGSLVNYSTWQTQFNLITSSGAFLTLVGRALTSDTLEVQIQKPVYILK